MSEDNKTPILDLSILDELEEKTPEISDYNDEIDDEIFKEKDKEFKELVELQDNIDESDIKDAINELKDYISTNDEELTNLLEKTQNKMTYIKTLIEYRVNKSLMLISSSNYDKDQVKTDISIIKYFQDNSVDFSHMHFHLNYNPNKKEEYLNFSELIDEYIEEVKQHHLGNSMGLLNNEDDFDPLYELRSIKFQEYMKNEVEDMLQEEKERIEKEDSKTK